MAKNSIEINLTSTKKEDKDTPAIAKSEEKAPVQAVSTTEEKVENVVTAAEAVVATAKRDLEERAAEARANLPRAARLESDDLPQFGFMPKATPLPQPTKVEEEKVQSSKPSSPLVHGTEEQKDWFEGFAESDTGKTIKHPSKPEFHVGDPSHQWKQERNEKGQLGPRIPLMSFRGHEGDRTDDPEKFSTPNIVQAMQTSDQGVNEDPLSDIATDRTKVESVLGEIDENTDELEELTEDELKSRSIQAMSTLDKGQEDGPLAGGGDDGKGGRPTAVDGDEEGDKKTGAVFSFLGKGLDKVKSGIDKAKEKVKDPRVKAFLNVVGKMTAAMAFTVKAFAVLDKAMAQMGKEMQNFAPEIILEKVDRNLMLLEKRMERAGTLGGSFAEMEHERTRLIEVVEDFKTLVASVAVPMLEFMFDILADILEAAMWFTEWLLNTFSDFMLSIIDIIDFAFGSIPWVAAWAQAARKAFNNIDKNTRKKKPDPAWEHMDRVLTLLVGKGTNVPGFNRGGTAGGPPASIASGL